MSHNVKFLTYSVYRYYHNTAVFKTIGEQHDALARFIRMRT